MCSANTNYHHFMADGTVNLGYKVWPRRNSFLTNKSEVEAKKMRSPRCSAKQHAQNHKGVTHSLAKLCLFLVHVIIVFNPWVVKLILISSRGHVHSEEKQMSAAAWAWRAWSAATIPSVLSLLSPLFRDAFQLTCSATAIWDSHPPHSQQHKTPAPVKQSRNAQLT